MKNILIVVSLLILVSSCSSKPEKVLPKGPEETKNDEIQKEYVVTDSISKTRPGWIEDSELWARSKGFDIKSYRYFSFETEPKVSRSIACNLAKANARADIASEISTFIDKQLGSSEEGSAGIDENNPNVQALRQFVENTLAEKIQALIHGASVKKSYWEKRKYKEDLGAKRDFTAYTCGVLIRMSSKRLKKAIDEAANHVVKQVDDPETKENVKKALANISENFVKAKSGQL